MDICLLGYGRMGKEVERIALSRGHKIVSRIDKRCDKLPECDVVIEFTRPEEAFDNIKMSISQCIPIVSGTTGWLDRWDEIVRIVNEQNGALFYASNFSIGVFLFRVLNKTLAKMMNHHPNYEPSLEEIHHIHKLDYPSGTALTIANDILELLDNKSEILAYLSSEKEPAHNDSQLCIASIRRGEVPGTHTVRYESPEDIISITHEAKGRAGLALGAVLAAEFVCDKKGVFGMDDLIQ